MNHKRLLDENGSNVNHVTLRLGLGLQLGVGSAILCAGQYVLLSVCLVVTIL